MVENGENPGGSSACCLGPDVCLLATAGDPCVPGALESQGGSAASSISSRCLGPRNSEPWVPRWVSLKVSVQVMVFPPEQNMSQELTVVGWASPSICSAEAPPGT